MTIPTSSKSIFRHFRLKLTNAAGRRPRVCGGYHINAAGPANRCEDHIRQDSSSPKLPAKSSARNLALAPQVKRKEVVHPLPRIQQDVCPSEIVEFTRI